MPGKRLHLEDLVNPRNARQFTDTLSLSGVPVTSLFIPIAQLSDRFKTIYSLAEEAPSIEYRALHHCCPHPSLENDRRKHYRYYRSRRFQQPRVFTVRFIISRLLFPLLNFPDFCSFSLLSSDSIAFQRTVGVWDISEWAPGGLEQIAVQTNDVTRVGRDLSQLRMLMTRNHLPVMLVMETVRLRKYDPRFGSRKARFGRMKASSKVFGIDWRNSPRRPYYY